MTKETLLQCVSDQVTSSVKVTKTAQAASKTASKKTAATSGATTKTASKVATKTASKAAKKKASKKKKLPGMDGWTVKQLQDYLREQNGNHSNMNRTELLDLAKLYAKKPVEDPHIAAAYDEHYAELLQKRKMFEKINKVTKTL